MSLTANATTTSRRGAGLAGNLGAGDASTHSVGPFESGIFSQPYKMSQFMHLVVWFNVNASRQFLRPNRTAKMQMRRRRFLVHFLCTFLTLTMTQISCFCWAGSKLTARIAVFRSRKKKRKEKSDRAKGSEEGKEGTKGRVVWGVVGAHSDVWKSAPACGGAGDGMDRRRDAGRLEFPDVIMRLTERLDSTDIPVT